MFWRGHVQWTIESECSASLRDAAHDIWQFTDLSLKAGVKQEVAYSPVVIAGEATNQLSSSQFFLLE